MTLTELISVIDGNLQGYAKDSAETTALINEAILKIASGDMVPGVYQKSPPLPELYTVDTIDTVSGGIVDLPDDFNRDLIQVINSSSDEIRIEPSAKKFLHRYREQIAGAVHVCAVMGKRLLYRDIPADAETLTLHYYATPAKLAEATDEPTAIPVHLHRKLIAGYVCREVWNVIEDGIDGQKVNTGFYNGEYQKGLVELTLEIGIDEDPAYYDVKVDYCP